MDKGGVGVVRKSGGYFQSSSPSYPPGLVASRPPQCDRPAFVHAYRRLGRGYGASCTYPESGWRRVPTHRRPTCEPGWECSSWTLYPYWGQCDPVCLPFVRFVDPPPKPRTPSSRCSLRLSRNVSNAPKCKTDRTAEKGAKLQLCFQRFHLKQLFLKRPKAAHLV